MPARPRKSGVSGLNRVKGPKRADGTRDIYYYHRATGERILHDPTSAAGLAQIKALDDRVAARAVRADITLADIIAAWKTKNPKWTGLNKDGTPFRGKRYAENTRRMFTVDFDALEPGAPDLFPQEMTKDEVKELVDDAEGKRGGRAAQLLLSHMSTLFQWAMTHKVDGVPLMVNNPAEGVAMPEAPTHAVKPNRKWRTHEVTAFFERAAAEPGLLALLALCYYAGLRVSDAAAVRWDHYAHDIIAIYAAQKNDVEQDIDVSGALQVILQATPRLADTIAHSALGRAWSKSGYDAAFARIRKDLEKEKAVGPGLTFHGLRRTLASGARDRGATPQQIRGAIGNKSMRSAEIYADEADTATGGNEVRRILMDQDAAWAQKLVGADVHEAETAPA